MAASVRPIKARLGAARLLLEGMPARPTSEEYRLASATQRIAVVAAINEHNALHAEERADLSAMALKVPWAEEDKLMILSKLVQEEPEKMERARREQQDFESCPWYFTADEWEVLLDASVPQIVKRDSLVRRCVALGLRCPTETTKKLIASMWMIVSEPHKPNLLKLTPSSKVAIKKDVSKAFEVARKKLPPPAVYLAKLPARPQDLKRERPDFFATAYPSGEPVESKLDYAFLREFDNSYSRRGEGASGSCHSGAVANTQITQTMLQQMLMQGMNMMQQQQQGDLIQIMGGQGRSSTTSPRALGNLASIATPTGRFRRAASAPALPLAADDEATEEEAADEATEEQAVLAVEDAPKTPKTLKTPEDAPKTTEDAPKTTKAASQAAMALDNVLALSHERTERKKEEKKEAAKKEKEARKEAAQKEKEAKKVAASKEKEAKTEAAEKQRKAAETKASEGAAKPKKRKVAETKASEGEATEEDKAATKASEGEATEEDKAETKASEGEAEKVAETKASEGEAKPKKRGP